MGAALLRKKLEKQMQDKGYHPVELSFIQHGFLARATLRKEEKITPSPSYSEYELSQDDLKIKGLDRIKQSTITMITSIRTPDFYGIFNKLCESVTEKAVIIDTARTFEKEDWENFFEIIRFNKEGSKKSYKKHIAAVIFENSNEKQEIKKAYEYLKQIPDSPFKSNQNLSTDKIVIGLQEWLEIPIILLENKYVFWVEKNKKFVVPLLTDVDLEKPDSPETFKAGFLLAFAAKKALDKWRKEHHSNGDITNSWRISLEEAVIYGVLLCGTWAKKGLNEHPDKDALLKFASETSPNDFCHNGLPPHLKSVKFSQPENFYSLTEAQENLNKLIDLDTDDRLCLIESMKE